jgi:hypothetical protein
MRRLARLALAIVAVLAGCGALRTIHDRMTVDPLSPSQFHVRLTEKNQCLHCHEALKKAPAVPHPDYVRCAACHVAAD